MMSALLLIKIAWRNLWRNPRRTLLTALALGLGLALLLIAVGMNDGRNEQMIANGVRLGGGHVVVQAKGYQETHSQELLLPAAVVSATEELLHAGEMMHALQGVSPRLLASGLLSSAANASGVGIVGVIPEKERSVSLAAQRIVEGGYLDDSKPSGVVIGAELARKLEVQVGSKVVLMAQAIRPVHADEGEAAEGEIQSALFRVVGIFRTGLQEVDAYVIHLPLSAAQALLGEPDQVTQVAIFLQQESDSPLVARRLRQRLAGAPAEVLTWRESMVELAQVVWLGSAFRYVMLGFVLVMVGLGLLNTILMAVLERRYEFGVCAALGLGPGQLAGIVLSESLALAVISVALGLALGLSVHHYFATSGLDLRWFTETSFSTAGTVIDPILYSHLSLSRVAWSGSIVFVMAAVMALYPALKAARTELSAALRVL
ncbi:MAG: ABC transporter permease [Deltaproteobacteria bacterium]|nr:ABC transporter permease [Deltaproteobacteria bacterium]